MDNIKELLADRKIWVLFIALLIFKLFLLPWVEVTDSDAVSRIFTAEELINRPRLVSEGVWLPLHYYFTSLSILMSGGSLWYGPMIFHVLIGALTIFPLYRFTAREFNERGAMWAVIIYVLSPVVFRNSYHALAGVPNAFFIMTVMDFMSRLRHSGSLKDAVYAGVFMTIACGFRYESWLLFALFTGMLLLFRVSWKKIAVFWLLGMIIPIFWMIGNYVAHGHLFYGITGVYNADVVEMQNADIDLTEKMKRLIFFPLSWVLNYSPLIALSVLFLYLKKLIGRKISGAQIIWSLPLIVLFFAFILKSYEGTLLNQQRFTIALILLAAPFAAYLSEIRFRFIRAVLLVSVPLLFIASFGAIRWDFEKYVPQERVRNALSSIRLSTYSTLSPIPRQTDPEIRNAMAEIAKNAEQCDGLVVDFWTWESSFCMALNSGFHPEDIFLVDGVANGGVYEALLADFLARHKKPMILFNCRSKLLAYTDVKNHELIFKLQGKEFQFPFYQVYSKDGMMIEKCVMDRQKNQPDLSCPEPGSRSYYRMEIRQRLDMLNDVKLKAAKNGIGYDEMLNRDAQWLVDYQ